MSRYVMHVLQPGETVAFDGTIHWLFYGPAIFFALLALAGAVLGLDGDLKLVGYGLSVLDLIFGLVSFACTWFAFRNAVIAR